MRRPSVFVAKDPEKEFSYGSRNWLLHARYVRGEHAVCLDLADELQKRADNTHRYAHYVKGLVYADAGRHQEALERFHSCIRLQPQDPEPLKLVAKSLSCQGRYQLSLEAYLEADKLTKHPDSDIYCALAECCSQLGQLERGVEWARAGVQAGGGERAGALLARLLLAAGDAAGAAMAYDHAIASHACGADTLAAAGALRLRAGAPREAFQLLGAALAQQPAQHAAALALAAMMLQHRYFTPADTLRLRAGAPREAFQLLGTALAQQPDQHAAALALAAMMLQHRYLTAADTLRLRAGAPREAFQLLGTALAQQPAQHAAALALAAMMLQHRYFTPADTLRLRAGAPREAFQLLGTALAQQPALQAAALALAAMMLQHRYLTAADTLRLSAGAPREAFQLLGPYSHSRDLDAALARLKAALSAHPTCVAAHSNLGLALLAKKKYVAALTCLQRAVWSAPLSARAAHNLGLALLLCRRPTSAFCRLATSAALQPHQPYTVLLIGIALERLGDARADAAYARAAALAPDDALVRLNRAGRLARSGNAGQAVEEARAVAQLLQREEKPDAQLSSSLARLLSLLREAGVQLTDLPHDLPSPNTPDLPEDDMTADEV